MKILITGICGFVGSTLARAWLEAEPGLTIYGLDSFIRPGSEVNRVPLQRLGIRIFPGDIRFSSDMEAIPSADWVIDAAANSSVLAGVDGRTGSRLVVEHNLLGTVNLLEYCKRHGAGFLLFSTSRVYSLEQLAALPLEESGEAFRLASGRQFPPGVTTAGVSEAFSTRPPVSFYGSTKLASEVMALEYGAAFGFPVWINRCGVLAGAGQFGRPDQGIFSYWIHSWLQRQPLTYIGYGGRGLQVRDCLHPRDLLDLLRKQSAPGASARDRIVNLGGGAENSMSLAELTAWCRDRFGAHTVASDPEDRRFDVPWLTMDTSLAREVWGWTPQTLLPSILEEIAAHAEQNPRWLQISGMTSP